jgi:hypothetical protein
MVLTNKAKLRLAMSALAFGVIDVSGCVEQEPASSDSDLPDAIVYKTPTCGCCQKWVEHLQDHGFAVQTRDTGQLTAIKDEYGLPGDMRSCHTAEIDGYVIEGHVPAADIKRLLRERPQAKGLAVPGMPLGSPGMEVDERRQAYTVWLLRADNPEAFNNYPARNLE